MKLPQIILVCFVLAAACKPPDVLEGTYSTLPGDAGTTYFFRSDSTFTSSGWTCITRDTGTGHYKLTRDSLIFFYDTMAVEKMSRLKVDTLPPGGDSCQLQFYVHDKDGALIFVTIMAESSTGQKHFGYTDVNGNATVNIPWNEFPVTITVKYVGYYSVQTTIGKSGNRKITIRMNSAMQHVTPGGTVLRYHVKKMTRRKVLLDFEYEIEGERKTGRHYLFRKK